MEQPEPAAAASPQEGAGKRRAPIQRASSRYFDDPTSGRKAIAAIVVADIAIVLVGGITIWLLDPAEYPQLATAFWYILQTITTVGYGDVTPVEPIGRVIGAAFMMLGIAFLAILTASITSSFIDARQAARRAQNAADADARWDRLDARLDAVIERLDRLDRSRGERSDT